jgi:hypothetical protein
VLGCIWCPPWRCLARAWATCVTPLQRANESTYIPTYNPHQARLGSPSAFPISPCRDSDVPHLVAGGCCGEWQALSRNLLWTPLPTPPPRALCVHSVVQVLGWTFWAFDPRKLSINIVSQRQTPESQTVFPLPQRGRIEGLVRRDETLRDLSQSRRTKSIWAQSITPVFHQSHQIPHRSLVVVVNLVPVPDFKPPVHDNGVSNADAAVQQSRS